MEVRKGNDEKMSNAPGKHIYLVIIVKNMYVLKLHKIFMYEIKKSDLKGLSWQLNF